MKKVVVLQIVNLFYSGGIREFLLNYYRSMDHDRFEFYFLVQRETPIPEDEDILAMGGKMFYGPAMYKNEREYCAFLRGFLKEHPEIDVIHCNQNLRNLIPLYVAWRAKVKMRISHCHKNENNESAAAKLKRNLICFLIKRFSTHNLACSESAARYMYGNSRNAIIINNALDSEKFCYNPEYRDEIRREFGLGDRPVVGHVGNFSLEKNQRFLLDMMAELKHVRDDAVLLMIGEGELFQDARKHAEALGLGDRVIFAKTRTDAYKFYSAFDAFVFPSKSEGFGMAIVEAECAGLPMLVAEEIHTNAVVDGLVELLPLKNGPEEWARKTDELLVQARGIHNEKKIIEAGFDMSTNVDRLQQVYEKGVL